jgi:hypothetical protein
MLQATHDDAPVADEKLPGEQAVQEVDPVPLA